METCLLKLMALSALFHCICAQGRRHHTCEQGSCYPATGDLLIGRESNLTTSSTCGLERPQRYCVVSYLEKSTKCFTCDSRQPWMAGVFEQSHRIQNIVSSFKDRKSRWWQAAAGEEKVYIQLDLEAEFHFTHLIMTFKTFRPKAMLIERSFDFGKTWREYRYFAENCEKSFPSISKRVISRISDIICEQRYSSKTPSTSGEVIFRVLPPSIPIADPYSQEVQDLLKLTNLRINFTGLHALGDNLLDHGAQAKEKYYYSLYDVVVRGSCSCYGHASRCLPVPGYSRSKGTLQNMVHGMCECTHNTKGLNCERCQDFYHDHPWRPARPFKPNVCKRCNCNNHATSCHFDAARFQASGGMSGGICDNCMHNTRGINCQECLTFYFQDPNRDIRDPSICQPCDCDTLGSRNYGECQQVTDETAKTVAGRCICKSFVTGARCDTCMDNYWNLQSENPLGCEPCSCNALGTMPGVGCNTTTGLCTCKRFVTGQNCDSCHSGFYGLSADNPYGCSSCDCDIGGAVKPSCDRHTGSCECRQHIRGKQCKQVDRHYFYSHLDYYKYEAEYGRGLGNARVDIREPTSDSSSHWTGSGYMKVMEGDSIEITISDLLVGTYYDIVIRYETKMSDVFRDVRVTVIRPRLIDPHGSCADFRPRDDMKLISLHPGVGHQVASPPSCLEQGKTYTIRLDFNMYIAGQRHPQATLLIDSILLIPNVNYIAIYQGQGLPEYLKNEFLQARCHVLQHPTLKVEIPEVCRKHIFSISAVLHNGAIECNCDHMGSLNLECNPSGGQCECKPSVVGRRCDQCAPGTFGFSHRGCSPCNCHEIGSRDNFCSDQTGKCTCIENVDGRACGQCRVGFWGFPQCRPCQCHGNADRCDQLTGVCVGCRGFSTGRFCDRCERGYDGDPRLGSSMPCTPCMCPGGPTSSVQHADTCTIHHITLEVSCKCHAGFSGRQCDVCRDNYFGAPAQLGGQCHPCICNNNINTDDPGSCDGTTGQCLKCLYNTEGFACEHCRTGYHGDATKNNCARCVCDQLGRDATVGECDRITGQCPCLPNVIGQQCDRCSSAFWNITSREGCTRCNCDRTGSVTPECNQLSGQCDCLPGRGGPKCADCPNLFYGDAHFHQCFPCDCNSQGSKASQCDRRTGQCVCLEGVTGYKCDRCARGTTGTLPNCVPCGECFDNWEKNILDLREQTYHLHRKASEVSVTGVIQVYQEDFRFIQRNIDEIKRILPYIPYANVDISDIRKLLQDAQQKLEENIRALNIVDIDLRNNSSKLRRDSFKIQLMKSRVATLKTLAKQLQDNVTSIRIHEVRGAYDKIKEADLQSRAAKKQADGTFRIVSESERIRKETESLVNLRQGVFQGQHDNNKLVLDQLVTNVRKLAVDIFHINNMVCGQSGYPCSALCGGGGCGRCGGDGCTGATTMSHEAVKFVHRAEVLLAAKERNATRIIIPKIQNARLDALNARSNAQMAFNEAAKAKNQTEKTRVGLDALLQRIKNFLLGSNSTSPNRVEQSALEVLAMQIPLQSEHIRQLANNINNVVSTLKDIEKVLEDTSDNRAIAAQLKQQADDAFADAKTVNTTAQELNSTLADAKRVQVNAEKAIEKAREEIQITEDHFDMISDDTGYIHKSTSVTEEILVLLKERLDQLIKRYAALSMDTLDKAEIAADSANSLAKEAVNKSADLDSSNTEAAIMLNSKHNDTNTIQRLAEKLKNRTDRILEFMRTKLIQLNEIQHTIGGNEKRLNRLQDEIIILNIRMDSYLSEVKKRAWEYETC